LGSSVLSLSCCQGAVMAAQDGLAASEDIAGATAVAVSGKTEKCWHTAKEGDSVILWGGYNQISGLVLRAGAIFNNRYGSFHHDDLIGQTFGLKVRPRKGGAWMALLRSTPELITQSLVHRTQIIYHADISLILTLLDVQPGKVIVEAGTGSGSLSSSFARALRPGGKLHTFEYHEERQRQAAADFERYGFQDVILSKHGDVCSHGFVGVPDATADGIFLDLPAPWQAIPHADRCLIDGGKVCTFSPCIEQIEKTAAELRRNDRYYDVRVFESLAMNWGVKEEPCPKRRQVAQGQRTTSGSLETAAEEPGSLPPPTSWLSYQMPMRSHTSYVLIATKPPCDEPKAVV